MTLPKRRVGKTRLEVTTIGLGGAPMGGFRATIPDAEAHALTEAAWDMGVRYYDTSPFYGYGRSELRMGGALREKPRSDFVLSTKIGRNPQQLARIEAMLPAGMTIEDATAGFRNQGQFIAALKAVVFTITYNAGDRSDAATMPQRRSPAFSACSNTTA